MAKPRLKDFKTPNFTWVHVVHPTALETKELGARYHFSEIDLKDVLPPMQRPKIVERDDYLFMILLFPVFSRATRKIRAVEVDFFIGRNLLVTTSSEDLFPLDDLFGQCRRGKDKTLRQTCASANPAELIYEILRRLEQYCFPISSHINADIDKVESEIFDVKNKKDTIFEVLRIKTNIVTFKKAMNRHTHVIQKFITAASRFLNTDKLDSYFKDLLERSEDLWQMLENYQDTIDAIHESHLSLLNHRSNVVMQVFTIFMTIIFSLELVISWITFDTQTLSFSSHPVSFLLVNTGLILIILVMIMFFRKRRWI